MAIDKAIALASCKDKLNALIENVESQKKKMSKTVKKENANDDVRVAEMGAMSEKQECVKDEGRDCPPNEKDKGGPENPGKLVVEKNQHASSKVEVSDVMRSHSFNAVGTFGIPDFQLQIRALPNGRYNIIGWDEKRSQPRMSSNGMLMDSGKLLCVKMVVFHDDVSKVFGAFRSAFRKAREWITLGKTNGRNLSEFLDMNIDVPDGCALEIPAAVDTWVAFDKLASATNLKRAKSGFKFWFSDEDRVLRFQCNDVTFDYSWDAKGDGYRFAEAESACDEERLLQLYAGRPGESGLFTANQKYAEIPLVKKPANLPKWDLSYEIPKWKSLGTDATLEFHGMMVGMAQRSDGCLNYFFSPYRSGAYLTSILIFPKDSYDDAYHAIAEAFKTALAWRDIAQRQHVLNIVKEMKISCPNSAAVEITGTKGAIDLLWKSVREANPVVQPTRFWFSVDTRQTSKEGGYVCEQENSKYYLVFGNADVQKAIDLDDPTIAAFSSINPQLALRAIQEAVQDKAKEKDIFK